MLEQDMSELNMKIWKSLASTPPEFTHPSSVAQADGTVLTLVQSQYRPMKMTEVFGPVGIGWGWEIHERWREDWGSIMCAYVSVSVWYVHDDEKFKTGIQVGGQRAGENVEHIWKSCITNGIAKCASSIGLCADVYMGEFEAGVPVSPGGKGSYPQRVVPGQAFDEKEPEKKQEAPKAPPPKTDPPAKPKDEPKPPLAEEKKPDPEPAKEEQKAPPKAETVKPSGRPTCPKPGCGSTTVGMGRNGKPHHCWDCNTNFNDAGEILS